MLKVSRSGKRIGGKVGRGEKQPEGVGKAKRFPSAEIKSSCTHGFDEGPRHPTNLHIFNLKDMLSFKEEVLYGISHAFPQNLLNEAARTCRPGLMRTLDNRNFRFLPTWIGILQYTEEANAPSHSHLARINRKYKPTGTGNPTRLRLHLISYQSCFHSQKVIPHPHRG